MRSDEWREMAACRGWGVHLFFPPDDPRAESPGERRIRESQAKRICRTCCVQEECLEWALAKGETRGIWGGRNELERKALLRARRRIRVVV
jgi:WhiB family redox-sensing transcriptional regulator